MKPSFCSPTLTSASCARLRPRSRSNTSRCRRSSRLKKANGRTTIVWGADNVLKSFLLEKGDVDAAWASAAHIVEGEYRTGAQEHLYIENNGVIAEYQPVNGVTVWGSLQCPYYVHKSLLAVFRSSRR